MKNIFLMTCAIGMFVLSANTVKGNTNVGPSKVMTGNTESVFEHRTIVPYPYPNTNQKIPATTPAIETMPSLKRFSAILNLATYVPKALSGCFPQEPLV